MRYIPKRKSDENKTGYYIKNIKFKIFGYIIRITTHKLKHRNEININITKGWEDA